MKGGRSVILPTSLSRRDVVGIGGVSKSPTHGASWALRSMTHFPPFPFPNPKKNCIGDQFPYLLLGLKGRHNRLNPKKNPVRGILRG